MFPKEDFLGVKAGWEEVEKMVNAKESESIFFAFFSLLFDSASLFSFFII